MREMPQRKRNRLQGYDYSQNGAYFITICAKNRAHLFGTIVGDGIPDVPSHAVPNNDASNKRDVVDAIPYIVPRASLAEGVGASLNDTLWDVKDVLPCNVPYCRLSPCGTIIENTLTEMVNHYQNISVPYYVIMPNHVHLLVVINDGVYCNGAPSPTGTSGMPSPTGTSGVPSPTNSPANAILPTFVATLKRFSNKQIGDDVWQRSFHDHIVRNEDDYNRLAEYIKANPARWTEDCFYRSYT